MTTYKHSPQKIYQEKAEEAQSLLEVAEKQLIKLSWARLFSFLITVVLLIYWSNIKEGWAFTATLLVGGLSFVFFLVKHTQQQEIKALQQALFDINQEELARLAGNWSEVSDRHTPEVDYKHLYAQDLDVFGNASIYKLLRRTGSRVGASMLQNWLLKAGDKETLEERHQMVKELIGKLDFRQQLQAYGLVHHQENDDTAPLHRWMQEPEQIYGNKLLLVLRVIGPILMLAGAYCFFILDWPLSFALLFALPNAWVLLKTAGYITQSAEKTSNQVKILRQLQKMMQLIESETWEHPRLKAEANRLRETQASKQIENLANILHKIEVRGNPVFYIAVNVYVLFDVFWMAKLEKWKIQHKDALAEWLESTGHIEALSSLAGFAYSNPQYVFPTISEKRFLINAKQLGHPLIHASQRVSNDFHFEGKGRTGIITGSNMSGKSTFERTVGVNAVLAFAGAPVCADSLEIAKFQIFTSMRTQDSLEENVSGFYAELKRLEQLIQLLKEDVDIFYVLDEILKGTNSADRNAGAKAIIEQVGKYDTFGLISTHDLALGQLAEVSSEKLQNFSFNSHIDNGELKFDYKISLGVCHSFSATALMRRIGIEIGE